jgi:hypothetical protein
LFPCGVGVVGTGPAKVDPPIRNQAQGVGLLNVTQKNYSGGLLLV